MMKFTDTVLADRPWDWYVKTGAIDCYFEIAERLAQLNDQARSQAMLRRAWAMVATMRALMGWSSGIRCFHRRVKSRMMLRFPIRRFQDVPCTSGCRTGQVARVFL